MHEFYLDGVSCRQFCISISGEDTFNSAERDIESVPIPGRSGELTLDNKRFKNVPVPYPAIVLGDFRRNAAAARAWLLSVPGYRRLEDSYHPEEFRLARYYAGLEFKPWAYNRQGEVTITFDCMPQRFLKSGEEAVTLTAAATLYNPTLFEAQPMITVRGSGAGSLTVNGHTVAISEIGTSVTLNTEILLAYNGLTRRDQTITGKIEQLRLKPGANTASFSGGVSSVEIIPRWWTI